MNSINKLVLWWQLLEIEVILNFLIKSELLIILVLTAIFLFWSRIKDFNSKIENNNQAYDLKNLSNLIYLESSKFPEKLNFKSYVLDYIIKLVQKLDLLETKSTIEELRKKQLRQKILTSELLKVATKMSSSTFFYKRAIALDYFQTLNSIEMFPELIKLLSDPIAIVRLRAARLLLKIGDNSSVSLLLNFLKTEKRYVRNLIHLSSKEATNSFVTAIRNHLYEETDVFVQKLCLDLISFRLQNELDTERLYEMRKSEHVEMRISILRAFFNSKLHFANQILKESFADTHWEVRANACRIAGKHQLTGFNPELINATRDSEWWVRRNACFALLELGENGQQALIEISKSSDNYAREMAELALSSKNIKQMKEAI